MKYLFLILFSVPVWAQSNKVIVEQFYKEAFIEGNAQNASRFLSEDYKQHNPHVADGKDGFLEAFKLFDAKKYSFKIHKIIADDEFVVLHLHVKNMAHPKSLGRAVIDIFRVKNNQIVEHWDVAQEVPQITVHNNSMF